MSDRMNACVCAGLLLAVCTGRVETPAQQPGTAEMEPWLERRLDWFQDLKFGFMMHWAPYSQWGCIESWPLVEN